MAYLDSGDSGKTGGGGGLSGLLSNNSSLSSLLGAGGGALAGLLGGSSSLPYAGNLEGIVGQIGGVGAAASGEQSLLQSTGLSLINPLQTGNLPPGAQAEVDQVVNKQIADTKAKYAQLGQTGSTMEQSALNDINTNKSALTFQIAQQMAQTGLSATGQSLQALGIETAANSAQANIYKSLMDAQMKNDSGLMSSIGSFASAFAKALPSIAAAA